MYKHIVFDIDGTLIDTEFAVLHSLQDILKDVLGQKFPLKDLEFTLGITGENALKQLKVTDIQKTLELWNEKLELYKDKVVVFEGIKDLLQTLTQREYQLGIVTSKTRNEYKVEVTPFELDKYFDIIICADDTSNHKPNPEPLLKYLELSQVDLKEIIYIGDSVYDYECATSANIDFAFAKWGNKRQNIDAKYILESSMDLLNICESLRN